MSYDLFVVPPAGQAIPSKEVIQQALLDLPGCQPGSGPCYQVLPEEMIVAYQEPSEGDAARIVLSVSLPLIDTAGERAVRDAFTLAEHLGWSVFDPQLNATLQEGDRARLVENLRSWKAMANSAVTTLLSEHYPPGWAERDGWWVPPASGKQDDLAFLSQPTPRPYGWFDQIKVDARAGVSLITWICAAASIVAGMVFFKWYLFAFGVGWFWMFGPTFLRLIRLVRDGEVRIFDVTAVTTIPLIKTKGSVEVAPWPDQKNNVVVPLGIAQALAHSGGLEVKVLVGKKIEETSLLGMRSKMPKRDA